MGEKYTKTPHVHRIDSVKNGRPHNRGWQFYVTVNARPETKLFSDSLYGGKHNSFLACKAYRDKRMMALFGELNPNRKGPAGHQIPPEGRIYVNWRDRPNGWSYQFIEARIRVDGVAFTKRFGCWRRGSKEAKRLALEFLAKKRKTSKSQRATTRPARRSSTRAGSGARS